MPCAVERACVRVIITITIPGQYFNSGKCKNHNNNDDDNNNDNDIYNNIVMTIKLRLVNYYVALRLINCIAEMERKETLFKAGVANKAKNS